MKRWLTFLIAGLVVLAATLCLSTTAPLRQLDTAWQDTALRWSGVRHWPSHVVLVTVDEPSLVRFRDDPLAFWTPHFAKAAQRLRQLGVKTIGIDFLFSISPEGWLGRQGIKQGNVAKVFDAPLREQINSGQVVLVSSKSFNADTAFDDILMPDAGFLLSVPDMDFARYVALADLFPDRDGAVRSFVGAPPLNLPPATDAAMLPRYSLAALLAQNAGGKTAPPSAEKRQIAFSGPPGTIPRISLSRLLADNAKDDALLAELSGKVAIIAGEFAGMGDVHATPYGASMVGEGRSVMIGAEVQANIVEQLLAGLSQKSLPAALRLPLLLLLALAGLMLGQLLLRGRVAGSVGGLVGLLVAIFAAAALAMANFVVVGAPELALAVLLGFTGSAAQALTPVRIRMVRLQRIFGERIALSALHDSLGNFVPTREGRESFPVAVLAVSMETATEALSEQVSELIRIHGGTVSSGEGHLVLGYFGWPLPTANPSLDALVAALALRRENIHHGGPAGIAVAAGEVLFVWRRGMISAFGDAVAKACGMAFAARQAANGALWIAAPVMEVTRKAGHVAGDTVETPVAWADGGLQEHAVSLEIR